MNYSKADSLLAGRNKLSRKVGNNTYLMRWDGAGEAMIRLKLHDTYES